LLRCIQVILTYIMVSFAFIFWSSSVYADIVSLWDGTVLNGKIIKRTSESIVVSNYYGTFTIKTELIEKMQVTSGYTEDIQILKRMGRSVNRGEIKRNYDSGFKKKIDLGRDFQGDRILADMGFSISTTYFFTVGKLRDVLPYGYGSHLSYELGKNLIYEKNPPALPDIKAEIGYLRFVRNPARVTGFFVTAGPIWLFPVAPNHRGRVRLAFLSGVSFLSIEGENFKTGSNTLILNSVIGYEYPLKEVILFLNTRYTHIYDVEIPLRSIGIELGVGYKF
jgi:hypothetical protein